MNREIYPGGIYPLQGDVLSQAGNNLVAISKLQGTSLNANSPTPGTYLIFDGVSWSPRQPWNNSVEVNGISISDDFDITVNVIKPVLVNGV